MDIIKAMNLKKYYISDTYEVRALDGVSLVVKVLLFIASVKFFCKFRYSMIIDCGLTAVFGG